MAPPATTALNVARSRKGMDHCRSAVVQQDDHGVDVEQDLQISSPVGFCTSAHSWAQGLAGLPTAHQQYAEDQVPQQPGIHCDGGPVRKAQGSPRFCP